MKTLEQTITKAIYDPFHSRITFFKGDKPSHGFVGAIALKKFFECTADKNIELIIKGDDNMEKSQLIQQFHAILSAKGIMDMKSEIVGSYGVKSTKDLSEIQLTEIISNLNNQQNQLIIKKRSEVLDLLGVLDVRGSKLIGWDYVNNYLLQPRISGKKLYEMSVDELKDCAKRLRMIISKRDADKAHTDKLKKLN
jgi:hypothetical protein